MTAAGSSDRYPALQWPDGLARIRPAHVIRCGRPEDLRPTVPEADRLTLSDEADAWALRWAGSRAS